MDDVRAVMDAAGVERAAIVGISEGGPLAMLFAATYPERVSTLVLWGSFAKVVQAPGYPEGVEPATLARLFQIIESRWGTGRALPIFLQGLEASEHQPLRARMERNAATPGAALSVLRMATETDAREVAKAVRAPTLVVHRTDDPLIPVACGRYVAAAIPEARLAELPGAFHLGARAGMDDDALDVIETFLTGSTPAVRVASDRVLATIVFTDIVGSTALAAELGDRVWRDRLELFDRDVEAIVTGARGRVVDTTGDGTLSAFDGPGRAILAAREIGRRAHGLGFRVRAGAHTGECEVRGEDLAGIAVHVAARVAGLAAADEILVTSTVRDLVAGSGLTFGDRGLHSLRGVPDPWHLVAVDPDGATGLGIPDL
jgi:class 3 adenylate cyclase